jgi:hypothetical protein
MPVLIIEYCSNLMYLQCKYCVHYVQCRWIQRRSLMRVMLCYLCVMLCYTFLMENEVCCAQVCAMLNCCIQDIGQRILDTDLTCISIHVCGIGLMIIVDF